MRARKRLRGRLDHLENDTRHLIRKNNIRTDSTLGRELEQIGLARQADEVKSTQEIAKILEDTSSEGGVKAFTNEDGSKEFVGAQFSPEQIEGVLNSTVLPETLRKVVSAVNDVIGRGRGIDVSYFAATRRDAQGRTRYSSGIKRSDRVLLPYSLEITKAGNFVFRALDYTKLQEKVGKLLRSNTRAFKDAFGNEVSIEQVMGEFRSYVENLSAREGVRKPSAEVFGTKKRNLFQRIMGPRNPEGNLDFTRLDESENLIRTFRPDRITRMVTLPDLMPPMKEQAYKLAQANFSKVGTVAGFEGPRNVGQAELWDSPDGFHALRPTPQSKIPVYNPTEKKIPGFFNSLEVAREELRTATEERAIQKARIPTGYRSNVPGVLQEQPGRRIPSNTATRSISPCWKILRHPPNHTPLSPLESKILRFWSHSRLSRWATVLSATIPSASKQARSNMENPDVNAYSASRIKRISSDPRPSPACLPSIPISGTSSILAHTGSTLRSGFLLQEVMMKNLADSPL